MKIGFPRALSYYDFFPFWAGFFQGLDLEFTTSPLTNRRILELGLKKASDDTCLPVKILTGHIQALTDVDAIFLPRMVSVEKNTYLCPKLLGLPESVLSAVPETMRVLTVDFNRREGRRPLLAALERFGESLGRTSRDVRQAFALAEKWQNDYEEARLSGQGFLESMGVYDRRLLLSRKKKGNPPEQDPSPDKLLTIALVGHSYLTQEAYANLDLLGKLGAKVRVRLIEEVTPEKIEEGLKDLRKKMFWSQGKKILGAGSAYAVDQEVDGLIYLSCFGCGTDSVTQDMVARIARRHHKPYMALTLDEHSGEAGLLTRLEAFLDMTERRVRYEDNLSAHGKFLDRHSSIV